MSIAIEGQTYYRANEVCRMVGISKSTLLRNLKSGTLREAELRDRRGWRLFARDEVDQIRAEVYRTSRVSEPEPASSNKLQVGVG